MNTKCAIGLFILSGLFVITAKAARSNEEMRSNAPRSLYAVNESSKDRGSISVYDIDAGHRLIKTIQTVPGVDDVRGVAVSAATGKLYVAYRDVSGTGMVYCLDVYNDSVLWNRAINPGVDRLAINPDGKLLYVPTWEGGSADYINVVDSTTGQA
jgi:DNA-binding beta-propeller fold protein YncE